MDRRVRSLLLAAAAAAPALGLAAQEPVPTPPNPTPTPVPSQQDPAPAPRPTQQGQPPAPAPAPAPTPPAPGNQPVDEAGAAADLLRRRLGLQPGPQGQPPAGPPKPPVPAEPRAGEQHPAPAVPPVPAGQQPAVVPSAQEPKPPAPADPTNSAAEAIKRLLPGAKPPAAAPIPNASGTPEPIDPRAVGTAGVGAAPSSTAPPPVVGLPWSGTLSSRYRARHGAGASDQEVTALLNLDFGLAERDPWTFHFSGRGFADLDGSDEEDDPFQGLNESLGEVSGLLYEAHLDAHRLPHVDLARIGRQYLDETPTALAFDGLRIDSERFGPAKAFVSAYGGIPVHHYEASSSGDSVYGLGGGFVPWQDARVRLDWMSLRDEFLATDQHDELLGVRWWQNLEGVQLHGFHTWNDGKPRDLHLGAVGEIAAPLSVTCDYRELLTTQRAEVTELDPYYLIAAEYYPYRQVDATVSYDLDAHWTLGAGGEVRRLQDRSDEGDFNREFERVHGGITVRDLGTQGLTLGIDASVWDSDGEYIRTITGDLEYRPSADLRVVLGTGYDLFRYDAFDDREREDVRSCYLRSDYRLSKVLKLDFAYEYQRDDEDEFHLFRLGVTWTL